MFSTSKRLRPVAVAALALLMSASGDLAAATRLKLFILAGQSNTMCCGMAENLPADLMQPQKNVKIYGVVGGGASVGTMEPNFPWPNVNGWGDVRPGFWPAECGICQVSSYLTLARDLAAALPNDSIAIVVCCAAPTTLAVSWRPPSSGGTKGPEYTSCLIGGVRNAIAALGANYEAEIAGMCWIQGESDAQDQAMANEYKSNLTNLINDVRRDLNVPRLPFVIGMIDTVDCWPLNATVRKAETDVAAAVTNVGINDTKGFPKDAALYPDNDGVDDFGHYSTYGHMILGTDFAASMLRLLANPTPGDLVAPSDLAASTPANGQVKLTWRDNSASETGFVIERKAGLGSYAQIGTASAGTAIFATYTDNTVTASTGYTYRVKATNGSSATSYSNESSIVPFGAGSGLNARYYSDAAFTTLVTTKVDTTVAWRGNASPATGISATSKFSVRWTGYVVPRYTENYAFLVYSDNMGTVWINDQLLIDPQDYLYKWGGGGPAHSGQIKLTAGQPYAIKVEYNVTGGNYSPHAYLLWKSPSQALQIIPKSQLYQNSPDPVTYAVPGSRRAAGVPSASLSASGASIRIAGLSSVQGTAIVVNDVQGRVVRAVRDRSAVGLGRTSGGIYFVTVKNARGVAVNRAIVNK